MSDMVEVLFTSDSSDNQSSCTAWDYRTSTNLMSYKGGGIAQGRSLCLLHNEYVLSANSAKPLLHVWSINSQEQISQIRFVVPGRVNAMAISPCGVYLVAGIQETIYIWRLLTGKMLNTISKHYQTINCLRFTDDGSHFVSAGQDGGVLVWNLTQVVARSDENQMPLYSFNDNGLPVTDVHVGVGGIRAYMMTVSLDRTCKVYDLSNGTLLLSVVFAEGLHCVQSNATENCFYVGSAVGKIYECHIDSIPRTKEYHMDKEHSNVFSGHKDGSVVNCLALSLDGQTLFSGGQDEQVCIWHIPSRQLLKVLTQKGAVTNLALRLTSFSTFQPERKQPHRFGANLKRMIDPPDADEDETIEVLVAEADIEKTDETIVTHTSGTSYPIHSAPKSATTKKSSDNEDMEKLQSEIQYLKHINKRIFEVAAKKLLKDK